MKFGERLRELRKARGITQRDLASMIERDYTYISKIETGDTPPPSLETIHRMALALAADENELVELANKVSIAAYRARIEALEQKEQYNLKLLLEYYRIVHAYGGPLGQHMPDNEYLEIRQRIDILQAEARKLLFP